MTDSEITQLLMAWGRGDRGAADRLFPLVYDELRRMASRPRRRAGGTLGTTALVHEAYVKLIDASSVVARDRGHFFALAARAMRQILVDYARGRATGKRGGGIHHTAFDESQVSVAERAAEVVALHEALERLERVDPRLGQVVELRFFGGLSVEEAADALELSPRTVKRDWRKARAFLHRELRGVA